MLEDETVVGQELLQVIIYHDDQERSVGVRANETTVVDFTPPVKVDDKQPLVGMQ